MLKVNLFSFSHSSHVASNWRCCLNIRNTRTVLYDTNLGENLLLTADYNVKLADFGLAVDIALRSNSLTNSSHAPTSTAGTYHFMAPEVIRSMGQPQAYGRPADIWSVLLFNSQILNQTIQVTGMYSC